MLALIPPRCYLAIYYYIPQHCHAATPFGYPETVAWMMAHSPRAYLEGFCGLHLQI